MENSTRSSLGKLVTVMLVNKVQSKAEAILRAKKQKALIGILNEALSSDQSRQDAEI